MPRYGSRGRRAVPIVAAAFAIASAPAIGACGGDDDGSPRLTVFAASSLTTALESCAPSFEDADVRLSFAGSDELAAQIRQGVRPDAYAAANTALPDELQSEGLVERPIAFASNELVVAVPGPDSPITALSQLTEPGVTVAVGSPTVPVGAYTREVLGRMAIGGEILEHVRSEEPDVTGIVGKLTQGAVDAGFVYATDVTATNGALRAIELPPATRPDVAYAAAVVDEAPQADLARAYVDGLRQGPCADALLDAGFGPPPER
jgi:molybdate transport system substrate-binding protein